MFFLNSSVAYHPGSRSNSPTDFSFHVTSFGLVFATNHDSCMTLTFVNFTEGATTELLHNSIPFVQDLLSLLEHNYLNYTTALSD